MFCLKPTIYGASFSLLLQKLNGLLCKIKENGLHFGMLGSHINVFGLVFIPTASFVVLNNAPVAKIANGNDVTSHAYRYINRHMS